MFIENTFLRKRNLLKAGSMLYKVFRLVILSGLSYILLYPVLKQVSMSLAIPKDLENASIVWIPEHFTFTNYLKILNISGLSYSFNYLHHFWVSVKVSVISTLLQLVFSSLIAYGLAWYPFKGNKLIFGCVLLTIIIPVQASAIPLFLEYRFFNFFGIGDLIGKFIGQPIMVNLYNTHWVYFVPAMLGVGVNSGVFIFIFRQFFMNMPKELSEAARVDGCGALGTYIRIIVPNAVPVFVTVGLLSLTFYWNDSMISNLLLSTFDKFSLVNAVDVWSFGVENGKDINEFRAEMGAMLLIVHGPLMFLFIVGQKFFVESMDRSGIKG